MKISRLVYLALFGMIVCVAPVLAHPGAAIAVGRDGRVFFVDTGRGIFEIGRDGQLRRHNGPAFHWFAFDPTSRFAKTSWPAIPDGEIRSVGLHPTLALSSDFPVVIGRDEALYYPELDTGKQFRINRISPTGKRSVHARLPKELRPDGSIIWIGGLADGAGASLYYTQGRAVRKISGRGIVSTIAANVIVPQCVPIPGIEPEAGPYFRGLDVAEDGTVFVAASGCGAVLKITAKGQVTPILRTASPYSPTAVAVSNGEVYVLEYLHTASDNRQEWLPRVRKITKKGSVVTLVDVKQQ